MQNLYNNLKDLLQKDDRLVAEGKLFKNKIIELALALDVSLLKLLLSNATIKKHFFTDVDGVLVFDKIKFQKFISNKQFLPDSYTAFKNKIGLTVNDEYISESKDVVLAWPYKDCVLEGGQTKEDAKRNEIFWNETLAPDEIDQLLSPKVLTNLKKHDKTGEHSVAEITLNDNLLIKGNNLLALHSLEKVYRGKVKLIYIDPPYNTGNDSFQYNDNFNHSTWLTFMKNRLEVSLKLLKPDGLLAVSIDDRELHYAKILLDGIFGRENRLSNITVKVKDPAGVGQQTPIFDVCEFLLLYAKNINEFKRTFTDLPDYTRLTEKIDNYKNHIIDYGAPKFIKEITRSGVGKIKIFSCENYSIKSTRDLDFKNYIDNRASIAADYNPNGGMILAIKNEIPRNGLSYIEYTPLKGKTAGETTKIYFLNQRILSFLSSIVEVNDSGVFKKTKLTNLWEVANSSLHLEGGVELKAGKKPEVLIKKIIEIATNKNDIVLDFHLGCGTSCAVAHKLNRRFIGVEQLDYGNNDSLIRLNNVILGDKTGISKSINWQGGGSFISCELAKANQEFIDKIQEASTKEQLQSIWAEMQKKAFISYNVNIASINDKASGFDDLSIEDQQKFLIETLDKNLLYVPLTSIDDKDYNISEVDKKLNKMFYSLNEK